jgi:hypothetical protein
MRNVSNKMCRENQNTFLMFNNVLFRKPCRLWDNVEEYCRAGQDTDDHKIINLRFACQITYATNTHLEYVIRMAFHSDSGYTNAPQYYVLYTLYILYITCPVPVMGCSRYHAYSSYAVRRLVFHRLHNSVFVIHFYTKIRVICIPRIQSDSLVSIHARVSFS